MEMVNEKPLGIQRRELLMEDVFGTAVLLGA